MAAATAAVAALQARKAVGPIVGVEPADFTLLVYRMEAPLVVTSESGFFTRHHRYLTCYKGMFFHTRSREALELGPRAEIVRASRIWIPG